ncbi:MAG: hypothetical protein U1D30_05440 [Planctomycetota bacterium]
MSEAKSGRGQTGSFAGKIARLGRNWWTGDRHVGRTSRRIPAPAEFPPGAAEFTFPFRFPLALPAGDLQNVRLVALSKTDPSRPVDPEKCRSPSRSSRAMRCRPYTAYSKMNAYFAGFLHEGDGQARIETNDRYSRAAAAVTNPQKYRTKMPEWGFKITEKPGENQFGTFDSPGRRGSNILLQLGVNGGFGPARGMPGPAFRYEAGSPQPRRLRRFQNPEWVVVTRDLFADFGEIHPRRHCVHRGGKVNLDSSTTSTLP